MVYKEDQPADEGTRERVSRSPLGVVLIITVSVFVAETFTMGLLKLLPDMDPPVSFIVDAMLLVLFLVPILRNFLFKPFQELVQRREVAEGALREYQRNLKKTIEERTERLTEVVSELKREIAARRETETALQKSEERFRQLFEQTEDAIILFKRGTCDVIDTNPVAENMYGYSRQEFFQRGPSCMVSRDEVARFCDLISGIAHEKPFQIDRMVHVRKDGNEIIVSMRGKIVTIQNVDLVYCTVRDITERTRLEEEAQLIQAKLIHTNKMTSLGVLVTSIAHEINNPNNFIKSNAQLISRAWGDIRKILDDYYRENGDFSMGGLPYSEMRDSSGDLLTGIADGSRRISEIIENLKDFARQDSSMMNVMTDLNRAVSLAVSILGSQIRRCTDHFSLNLADDLPQVRGSLQQLEQVVINLVINALQALPARSKGVSVSTSVKNGFVSLHVSDQGVGIPPEAGERIMEPFFTTKLGQGGTGLGLSISHSIIRDHGGTMSFESRPGEGTTFTVLLPAVFSTATESESMRSTVTEVTTHVS
ncbi:ATP-binding protein [Geobacter sp. DSM 9736]|uniref:ATP-binding protein n=1 Tax=Geobacter sp. DSM 9736 TaxID=1277350 RepID=UPI000B507FBC|nr:ATP-binding protein [Geobacter sp. DSM 9736]SNB44956.1 PAS domain S-box-containing protein [Geobacter sp. DSM 9736]